MGSLSSVLGKGTEAPKYFQLMWRDEAVDVKYLPVTSEILDSVTVKFTSVMWLQKLIYFLTEDQELSNFRCSWLKRSAPIYKDWDFLALHNDCVS